MKRATLSIMSLAALASAASAQTLSNAQSDYEQIPGMAAETIDNDISGKNGWTNDGSVASPHYITWDVTNGIAGQYTFQIIQTANSNSNYSIQNYYLSFANSNGSGYQTILAYDSLSTTSGISLTVDGTGLFTAGAPTTLTNTYTMVATLNAAITSLRIDLPAYAGGPGGLPGEEETLFLTEFTAVATPVPESSSAGLLGFALLGLIARRRR